MCIVNIFAYFDTFKHLALDIVDSHFRGERRVSTFLVATKLGCYIEELPPHP